MTDSEGNEIGKLFIGGLSQATTNNSLRNYFSENFGEVEEALVMMDNRTGRSRGFGYVKCKDSETVDAVLLSKPHILDGKEIDAKQCNVNMKGKNRRSLKVFVGGIGLDQEAESLKLFFEQYGTVTDVNLMMDPNKQRHRGFAFIGFQEEAAVKHLIDLHYMTVNGKQVEIKAMEPPNFLERKIMDIPLPINNTSNMMTNQNGVIGDRNNLMPPVQSPMYRHAAPYGASMGYPNHTPPGWGVQPTWPNWCQQQPVCQPQWNPWLSYQNPGWYQTAPSMWPPQHSPMSWSANPPISNPEQTTQQVNHQSQMQWNTGSVSQWDSPTIQSTGMASPGTLVHGSSWPPYHSSDSAQQQTIFNEAGSANGSITMSVGPSSSNNGEGSNGTDYYSWMCNSKEFNKVMSINVDGDTQHQPGGSGDFNRSNNGTSNTHFSFNQVRR